MSSRRMYSELKKVRFWQKTDDIICTRWFNLGLLCCSGRSIIQRSSDDEHHRVVRTVDHRWHIRVSSRRRRQSRTIWGTSVSLCFCWFRTFMLVCSTFWADCAQETVHVQWWIVHIYTRQSANQRQTRLKGSGTCHRSLPQGDVITFEYYHNLTVISIHWLSNYQTAIRFSYFRWWWSTTNDWPATLTRYSFTLSRWWPLPNSPFKISVITSDSKLEFCDNNRVPVS